MAMGATLATTPAAVHADATAIAPAVHDAYRHLGDQDMWPGFVPHAIPLAVYDGSRTWLFDHPSPPAAFSRGSDHGAWVCDGRAPEVVANSSAMLGGVSTATLILPARAGRSPDSTRALAAVAIHEAFHVYQRARHPAWSANEADLFTYPADDESVLADVGLEREALRRAVADPGANAIGWVRAALAARMQRYARLTAGSIAYERKSELNEGLAQYVQNRALRLARGDDAAAPVGARPVGSDSGRTFGSGEPGILDGTVFPADGVRRRSYVTGEALAVLLDRYLPDWRDSLEAHDTRPLDVWLSERLGSTQVPAELPAATRTAVAAEARHEITALSTRRREARSAFMERTGITLVIEAEEDAPLMVSSFDPWNVLVVGAGEVLHTRALKLENASGSIEIFDRDALTEAAGPHPLFAGIRRVTISGIETPPDLQDLARPAHAVASGVTVSFTAARIEKHGDRITLHVPH